jgi:broad specificity phosphatase PhoE
MPIGKLADIIDDRPRHSIHLVRSDKGVQKLTPVANLTSSTTPKSASNERGKQEVVPPKPTEGKGDGARRITGSADIPLNADGKKESKKLADSLSEKFDWVLTSPEKRAVQTAKEFGNAIPLEGLDAWRRGAYEGQPVKATAGAMRFLMEHPNKKPPGVSPESKEPGECLNDFSKPLLGTIQTILAIMGPKDRGLVVSHGGNLQVIDAWLKGGKKEDLSFDHRAMAKTPYWSVTGELFKIGDNGLEKVKDNAEPGLYLTEHGSTAFNNSSSK